MNEHQAVGVELEGRGAAGECSATLAYSFEIPNAECTVKGNLGFINTHFSLNRILLWPSKSSVCCRGNRSVEYIDCPQIFYY